MENCHKNGMIRIGKNRSTLLRIFGASFFLLISTPRKTVLIPAFAGALSHLKTDFHFSLPDSNKLGNLLNLLHPTPAVCGLPKEEAYRFIQDNEKYDRRYYSVSLVH